MPGVIRNRISFLAFAIVGLVVTGCGGGGGTNSGSSGTVGSASGSLAIGKMSLAYLGKAQPTVSSGTNGLTVTSAAGISISGLTLIPNKTLSNTEIAYNVGSGIWTSANGLQTQITGISQGFSGLPIWIPGGALCFVSFDEATSKNQIYDCLPDGSNFTQLTNSKLALQGAVSITPDSATLAYDANVGGQLQIYTASTNGTGEKMFLAGASQPAYSPDGTKMAYVAISNGYSQIYTIPVGGGTPTLVSTPYPTMTCQKPTWTPDGKWIAYGVENSAGSSPTQIVALTNLGSGINDTVPQTAGQFDSEPSFSPDGTEMAFVRSSTFNGAGTLTTATFNGYNPTPIASAGGSVFGPTWSPYPLTRQYVGSSGAMFPSAAGFLWGQVNDVFASLVTFTATTPSTSVVTPQTGGSGPLVFTIQADSITGLKYTDAYLGLVTSVLPNNGTNSSSALVSFNATTGQVDTVAPFLATKSASLLKATHNGSQLVYNGKFAGIWNAAGKNLAPSGATQVVIDGVHGKLVSFR
jgi:hypothetical protein